MQLALPRSGVAEKKKRHNKKKWIPRIGSWYAYWYAHFSLLSRASASMSKPFNYFDIKYQEEKIDWYNFLSHNQLSYQSYVGVGDRAVWEQNPAFNEKRGETYSKSIKRWNGLTTLTFIVRTAVLDCEVSKEHGSGDVTIAFSCPCKAAFGSKQVRLLRDDSRKITSSLGSGSSLKALSATSKRPPWCIISGDLLFVKDASCSAKCDDAALVSLGVSKWPSRYIARLAYRGGRGLVASELR